MINYLIVGGISIAIVVVMCMVIVYVGNQIIRVFREAVGEAEEEMSDELSATIDELLVAVRKLKYETQSTLVTMGTRVTALQASTNANLGSMRETVERNEAEAEKYTDEEIQALERRMTAYVWSYVASELGKEQPQKQTIQIHEPGGELTE